MEGVKSKIAGDAGVWPFHSLEIISKKIPTVASFLPDPDQPPWFRCLLIVHTKRKPARFIIKEDLFVSPARTDLKGVPEEAIFI